MLAMILEHSCHLLPSSLLRFSGFFDSSDLSVSMIWVLKLKHTVNPTGSGQLGMGVQCARRPFRKASQAF